MATKRWMGWILGFGVIAMAGYFAKTLGSDDRRVFLPGATSHGHYQIELQCSACHSTWSGVTVEACTECHGQELDEADDSHPAAKFRDPRNADRLERLDARQCVTCHIEHRPSMTREMGVTLPNDYCFHCHSNIAEERPSHEPYGFDTCQSGGCHNFHDNRALTEDFLSAHTSDPDLQPTPERAVVVRAIDAKQTLTTLDHDAPGAFATPRAIDDWASSAHARAGVNCSGCHRSNGDAAQPWVEAPDHTTCNRCHEDETRGFLGGHHGMRLASGLSPMTPEMARRPMQPNSHARKLDCQACHGAHAYETTFAAEEACLGCHADEHSLAHRDSAHASLWTRERAGEVPRGRGVSCAACHLPTVVDLQGKPLYTQHNQNDNLRPNEKMVRSVCTTCHGVEFALRALADHEASKQGFAFAATSTLDTFALIRNQQQALADTTVQ